MYNHLQVYVGQKDQIMCNDFILLKGHDNYVDNILNN